MENNSMYDKIIIKEALPSDSAILTDISFASKRHWDYPDEYFDIWKKELTITESYILNNTVYISYFENIICGYYSMVIVRKDTKYGKVIVKKGTWLEHLFIRPDFIKKGIGRQLVWHAISIARELNTDKLLLFSDPFANGFYEKMGAVYLYESPSSIEGRSVSVYQIEVPDKL